MRASRLPNCKETALYNVLRNKQVSNHLKGEVNKALVLSTLLFGCEVLCLREDQFNRLQSFHECCVRIRVSLSHACPSRAPRQLLTGWVSHSRPIGCPQMTWGRTLENALSSKGISKDLDEWIAIAKDRSKWRQLAQSIPKRPDA